MADTQRLRANSRRFSQDRHQVGFLEGEGSEHRQRRLLPEKTFDISGHAEGPSPLHYAHSFRNMEILQLKIAENPFLLTRIVTILPHDFVFLRDE